MNKLRNDPDGLWRSWSKALSTVAFFAMPAFGIPAVTSRDVIVLALGAKWRLPIGDGDLRPESTQ
jgi:PST family polysaccharide transporter